MQKVRIVCWEKLRLTVNRFIQNMYGRGMRGKVSKEPGAEIFAIKFTVYEELLTNNRLSEWNSSFSQNRGGGGNVTHKRFNTL